MRGPFSALSGRFARRRSPRTAAAAPRPLPADMGRGASEMQQRLAEAHSRLKAVRPPLAEDDDLGDEASGPDRA